MKLSSQIASIFADASAGRKESALVHALNAVDLTSKHLFPTTAGVAARYKKCLRHYYWLLEPMTGAGINFEETRFTNLELKDSNPDFADVIYRVLRCNHAHGDEVPVEYELIETTGGFNSSWLLGPNVLRIPDRILWALTALVVLSRANEREPKGGGDAYFSLGDERFPIDEWWGREADFRPIAARYNQVRVKLDKLERLSESPKGDGPEKVERLLIFNPPSSD